MTEPFFELEVNAEPLLEGVEVVEIAIDEQKKSLKELEQAAKKSMNVIIRSAQLSWGVIQGAIRAAGGSISMTTRLIVSATFGAIQTLYPIIKAGGIAALISGDPAKLLASIVGLAQLGTAVAALAAFETDQKQISLQLRGLTFMMSNIGMMIKY